MRASSRTTSGHAPRRSHGRTLKILLVRLRLVGDVVFTTPAVHALRRRFPDARLDYLVEPAAAAVVRHSPDLDTVVEVARPRGLARLTYDLRLARRLRREGYDLALDFHGGPRSAWLVRASGASERWLRHPGPPLRLHDPGAVASGPGAAASLGVEPGAPPTPAGNPVRMTPGAPAQHEAAARLAAAGVTDDAPLVVLHVSASNPFRRWPRESFARVAAALALADARRRIMITAGPSSGRRRRHRHAARAAGPAADAIVRCGEPPLDELQVIMSRAQRSSSEATRTVPRRRRHRRRSWRALFGPTLPAADRCRGRDPALPAEALERAARCPPLPPVRAGDFRCDGHHAQVVAARARHEAHAVRRRRRERARESGTPRPGWAGGPAVASLQKVPLPAGLPWLAPGLGRACDLAGLPALPRFVLLLRRVDAALGRRLARSVGQRARRSNSRSSCRRRCLRVHAPPRSTLPAAMQQRLPSIVHAPAASNRPARTLSHWMTYSGMLMVILRRRLALLDDTLLIGRGRSWRCRHS